MKREEWEKQGEELFGKDIMKWRFVCPACGCVISVKDYRDAGAPSGAIGFSCIGRYLNKCREAFGGNGKGPCNYAGGGLFGLNKVEVDGEKYFDFDRGEVNEE